MKIAVVVSVLLPLFGCSHDTSGVHLPAAPSPRVVTVTPVPPPNATTSLWGMVVDVTGACIVGATVEVVGGQALGQRLTQTTPCSAWDYDGGFLYEDLT